MNPKLLSLTIFALAGTFSAISGQAAEKEVLLLLGGRHVRPYDPATNRWDSNPSIPPPPTNRQAGAAAAVLNNKVYLCGGYGTSRLTSRTCDVYDPATNQWERHSARMASNRMGFSLVAPGDDSLYALGGLMDGRSAEKFDPETNRWRLVERNFFRYPTAFAAAAGIDGTVYVAGGSNAPSDDRAIYSTFYQYNHLEGSGRPERLEHMPTPRETLALVPVESPEGDKFLYAVGGLSERSRLDVVERYDTESESWERLDTSLPADLASRSTAVDGFTLAEYINGTLVVVSADKFSTTTASSRLDLSTDRWEPISGLTQAPYYNAMVKVKMQISNL